MIHSLRADVERTEDAFEHVVRRSPLIVLPVCIERLLVWTRRLDDVTPLRGPPAGGRRAGTAIDRSPTSVSSYLRTSRCVSVNWPMTVASTPSDEQSASNSAHDSSGTASTIRSWASLIQISVYDRPVYLSGARSSQTSAPVFFAHLADGAAEARPLRSR